MNIMPHRTLGILGAVSGAETGGGLASGAETSTLDEVAGGIVPDSEHHGPRLGLALGSGAARGWAHIGVVRALEELGLQASVVSGTSIGALVGGFMVSGRLDSLEDWARRLTKLRMVRYLDFRLRSNGLLGGHRLASEMARHLGDTLIEDCSQRFASVVTDLGSGEEVWLTEGRMADAVRASFSLPAFFEPVQIDGRWVIDGAVVNPIPVSVCRNMGADFVLAVNLSTGLSAPGVRKAKADDLHSWSAGAAEEAGGGMHGWTGSRRDDMPSFMGVMASTVNIVQDRVMRSRMAVDPPNLTIVPPVGHIGVLEFNRAEELIQLGYDAVISRASELEQVAMTSQESSA